MIPLAPIAASLAVEAYQRVVGGSAADPSGGGAQAGQAASSFGDVLSRAIGGVVQSGHKADALATKALLGTGSLTDAATAVTQAELALQGATAIRDKVVQAYQDVMRMAV